MNLKHQIINVERIQGITSSVYISVSKIYIKVHKAQIEQKRNVVVVAIVVVVVVAILRYLGLCREAMLLLEPGFH